MKNDDDANSKTRKFSIPSIARILFFAISCSIWKTASIVGSVSCSESTVTLEEEEASNSEIRRSLKQFSKIGRPGDVRYRPFRDDAVLASDGYGGDFERGVPLTSRRSVGSNKFDLSAFDFDGDDDFGPSKKASDDEVEVFNDDNESLTSTEEEEKDDNESLASTEEEEKEEEEEEQNDSYVTLKDGSKVPTTFYYRYAKKLYKSEFGKASQELGIKYIRKTSQGAVQMHGNAKKVLKKTRFLNDASDEALNRAIIAIVFCVFFAWVSVVACVLKPRAERDRKWADKIES
jgi:hypothetical protein